MLRWDIWDIEEGDESTASPVTHSPLATCPRVTPLDCVDREETLDELSSGLDDEEEEETEEALTARKVFESLNMGALPDAKAVNEGEEVKVTTRNDILVIPLTGGRSDAATSETVGAAAGQPENIAFQRGSSPILSGSRGSSEPLQEVIFQLQIISSSTSTDLKFPNLEVHTSYIGWKIRQDKKLSMLPAKLHS